MPMTVTPTLAFLGLPGGMEWVVLLVIGLLLFGARLPMVGRNIGKSITEFKKGLKDASDQVVGETDLRAHDSQPGSARTPQEPHAAPRQLTNEQLMESATQEALRRLKAEQAANQQAGGNAGV